MGAKEVHFESLSLNGHDCRKQDVDNRGACHTQCIAPFLTPRFINGRHSLTLQFEDDVKAEIFA